MKFSEGTYRDLEEIEPNHMYGKIESASFADTFSRMAYDIQIGAIGGIDGKIIAFLSSFIVGSLPITGTMIWCQRRKKKRAKQKKTYKKHYLNTAA